MLLLFQELPGPIMYFQVYPGPFGSVLQGRPPKLSHLQYIQQYIQCDNFSGRPCNKNYQAKDSFIISFFAKFGSESLKNPDWHICRSGASEGTTLYTRTIKRFSDKDEFSDFSCYKNVPPISAHKGRFWMNFQIFCYNIVPSISAHKVSVGFEWIFRFLLQNCSLQFPHIREGFE